MAEYFVLELPFGLTVPGVQWRKDLKVHVLYADSLPSFAQPFRCKPFTYSAWVEDELNNREQKARVSKQQFSLKDHQKVGAQKISEFYKKGVSGFFIADKTGVGKTLSCLAGVTVSARSRNSNRKANVLVVCPKRVIPTWQQSIESFAVSQKYCQLMVASYSQLPKLLKEPMKAKQAKKTKTKNRLKAREGTSKYNWDFIIFDESHYLKNYPTSSVSLMGANIAQLNESYTIEKSPFTVFATATPGSSPLNFAVMAQLIAPLLSPQGSKVTPKMWGEFLCKQGFDVVQGKTGWSWSRAVSFGKNSSDPQERQKYEVESNAVEQRHKKDVARIGRALKSPHAPFIMRSPQEIAGFPEQQVIPMPIELDAKNFSIYEEAWSRFKNFMNLPGKRDDPKARLVENLRYRQKASYLKCESIADIVADLVEQDNQVYVSCFFGDSIEHLKELLAKKGIECAEITGKMSETEAVTNRLNFQKGLKPVVITSVAEGISLQANEILPDGSRATSKPRISIIFDIRADPNKMIQVLGRAHRNGENSLTYVPYFVGTVEREEVTRFANKWSDMSTMTGDDKTAETIDRTFR